MMLMVQRARRYRTSYDHAGGVGRRVMACAGARGQPHGVVLFGPNQINDGDMEAADISAWGAIYADLSKETGIQGQRCLRITLNDINHSPAAQQNVITVGKRYRVCGLVRSPSGHLNPKVYIPPDLIVVGDYTNPDWQFFDIEMDNNATSTVFRLYGTKAAGAAVGDYVEWDDVWVEEL